MRHATCVLIHYPLSCQSSDEFVSCIYNVVDRVDGTIPTENGMLTTLVTMQLAGNSGLTSSIPTELCRLTNITHLLMNTNRLSSSIPSCLGDLRYLQVLNLAANELIGTIPTELCQLSKLKELQLTRNMNNGTIPSCIESLPLIELDLAHNRLSGSIPNELGNLGDTLSYFSTNDNILTGDPSDVFNKLVRLRHLMSSKNKLNFTMTSNFLGNTSNLTVLDLSVNKIDGAFPMHILTTSYPSLEVMDLSNNSLTGKFTNDGSIASRVEHLSAHDNQMTGSLEALVNLTGLIHLDLRNNEFTGAMDPVGASIGIKYLFLSENPFIAGPIPEAFGLMSDMTELSLRNTNLAGVIPESIAENWTFVRLIDLGSNNLAGPIPENFGNLSRLEYLLLFDNIGINGAIPTGFQEMTQLKGVLLDRTSIVGTEALQLFCTLPNFMNVTGTELLIVDCDLDECTECEGCRCCSNATDMKDCSQPQLGNIDGMWIDGFRRPGNEFNFTDEL